MTEQGRNNLREKYGIVPCSFFEGCLSELTRREVPKRRHTIIATSKQSRKSFNSFLSFGLYPSLISVVAYFVLFTTFGVNAFAQSSNSSPPIPISFQTDRA
ncbi:MAG: hypothetical protein ACRD5J_15680, partial [Nitrososphaeraceae archaeon]